MRAAVPHGPLLPERLRQVLRGAFVAIGISLVITVLLPVILVVVQGAEAPTQQVADSQATQLVREDSPTGDALGGVGVLFALLPTILSTLWLFAHGLPMGLQGAQDLATIPLLGEVLSDAPLQVSLLGNWPGENAWRLLLLGPVIGLVAGGSASAGQHSVEGKLSEIPEDAPVKDYPVEIPVETNGNDVISAVIQRKTDAPGGIVVGIVDSDGETVKEGATTASYGVVSISYRGQF